MFGGGGAVAKWLEEVWCLMSSIRKKKKVGVGVCEVEWERTSTHWREMKRWREDETACGMLGSISMATALHIQSTAKNKSRSK